MEVLINSNNVIEEVQKRFPNFNTEDLEHGIHTYAFWNLGREIIKAMKSEDASVLGKYIEFVNSIDIEDLGYALSEIVACLYDSEDVDVFEFSEKLKKPLQDYFEEDIRLWEAQFRRE